MTNPTRESAVQKLREELRRTPRNPCCADITEGGCYCHEGVQRQKLEQAIAELEDK